MFEAAHVLIDEGATLRLFDLTDGDDLDAHDSLAPGKKRSHLRGRSRRIAS
jgi:hypothetical protein